MKEDVRIAEAAQRLSDRTVNTARVIFTPHPDSASEQARNLRARAWLFVFDAYARKNPAAGLSARDLSNGTASKEDSANGQSIPRKT
jgi:hypothetical protein